MTVTKSCLMTGGQSDLGHFPPILESSHLLTYVAVTHGIGAIHLKFLAANKRILEWRSNKLFDTFETDIDNRQHTATITMQCVWFDTQGMLYAESPYTSDFQYLHSIRLTKAIRPLLSEKASYN